MPTTFTTTLPDAKQPTLGNGVEDEVSYETDDNTNNGDFRFQIRETGETTWDSNATGFAENVEPSDSDTSGTINGQFTGREDGEEYEVRVRTETDDVTGTYTDPVSIVTKFPGASDLTLTPDSATQITATWTDNADNEDGFRVFRADEKDRRSNTGFTSFQQIAELDPNTESYVLTGLEPNTSYKVFIRAFTDDTTADSSTVTASTGPDLTLAQSVAVGESTERIQLSPDEILARNIEKTHTGVADARIEVPELDALIPGVQRQDRVNYYVDGVVVFTGYAVGFRGNDLNGRWLLRADGIGKRLEESRPDYSGIGGPVTYSNIALDEAIRDYWARTPFTATVTDQQTELVADDEQLQSADTTTEWNNIYSPSDDEPIEISSGALRLQQSADPEDSLDDFANRSIAETFSDDAFNDGDGSSILNNGEFIEFNFTFEYRIPSEYVGIQVRDRTNASSDISFRWNGTEFDNNVGSSFSLGWRDIGDGFYGGSGYQSAIGNDLNAGETNTLRIEAQADSDYDLDVVAVYDERFTYDFPNPDAATNAGGILDGPQEHPLQKAVELDTVGTSFNIESATVTSSWVDSDVSNSQTLQVSNDGGTNYAPTDGTEQNTTSVTVDFSDAGRQARVKSRLSRYTTDSTSIPATGDTGHAIDSLTLTADLNDLVVIKSLELTRDHFSNLKKLHDYGGFVWVIEHDGSDIPNLPVSSFFRKQETKPTPAEFDNAENKRPEVASEPYFNRIYLEGALQSDGTRPTADVKDQDAINNDGREITPGVLRDQSISTDAGATFRANALLESALEDNALRGTIESPPVDTPPGFGYSVDFGEGAAIRTLQNVSISERSGEVSAEYEFVVRERLSETLNSLKRDSRNVGNQV